MLPDETLLEILGLYEQGLLESEIAQLLELPWWAVRDAIDADAEAFPNEPLRVLH